MFSARHPELQTLAMRPGRRRMVEALLAAGPEGLFATDLAGAYYDGGPQPEQGLRSIGTQIQRLRSQVEPLGYILTGKRLHGAGPFRFVLASADAPEPEPEPETLPPSRPTPAETLGIRAVSVMSGGARVSLARCAWLEGAAA